MIALWVLWVILSTIVVIGLGWDRWICFLTAKAFKENEWSAAAGGRWRMIDDLIHSRCLRGMSREKVVCTLGTPDRQSQLTFVYRIAGPFMLRNAMRVCFDSSGRVFKVRWDRDVCP